jgi:hypothetical protein
MSGLAVDREQWMIRKNPDDDKPRVATGRVTPVDEMRAAGVMEMYTAAASIESADASVKAANVVPICTHLAFGIGGKRCHVLTDDVANVDAAVKAGSAWPEASWFITRSFQDRTASW